MRRFWMRSLTGQLIALMLFTLLLSQVVFYFINNDERDRSMRNVRQEEFIARAMAVARLIGTTDPIQHGEVIGAANTPVVRYWLSGKEPGDPMEWQQAARKRVLRALPTIHEITAYDDQTEYPPNPRLSESDVPLQPGPRWTLVTRGTGGQAAHLLDLEAWNGFGLASEAKPGLWLNAVYAKAEPTTLSRRYYVMLGVAALVLSGIAILAARRVGRPLRHLTVAAERLGRGEEIVPVPEAGADDIRHTAEAFNRMQSRLRRFVEDRTRMIAAISHDLRTPITSLRLRAEFIADPETREPMIATLDEMQAMTEAALAFSKGESITEPARSIDLAALLESLCDDLTAIGLDVSFEDGERIPWRCRPDALRRALRNVIENAVRYGERARVKLERAPGVLHILVDDDGPGMPEADFEKVFAPFVRLESSRNRDTGGVGLGLAIARSIVRSHGGDITLANREDVGLRVTIVLPGETLC
ncbi:HAMP domain-containing protein [Luteolibacter ambystomatis]|uniref:histidine kinase n=1 Tax=Luteolibacter ambystomatis TaxID=2824561 RepID=A0A975IZF8_9BACT|nr:ATP-binding protein [Luteolibacter ambystomatis]QUE49650.1 HAMP domain-containing protein [Luteolibacter ambystomatis]